MNYRFARYGIIALAVVGAVITGAHFVRAGLVTDFMGVNIDRILDIGPTGITCTYPLDDESNPNPNRQIIVGWIDQNDNEAGFIVNRQEPLVNGTSTARFQVPAQAGTGGTVTFTDTRVAPDTHYTYTVWSFLGPAQSPSTTPPLDCITQSLPNQPTDVLATGGPENTMILTWRNSATNAEGFYIYRYSSHENDVSTNGCIVGWAGANNSTYPDGSPEGCPPDVNNPMRSNTQYCYRVVAYNSRGPGQTPPPGVKTCGQTWSQQPTVVLSAIPPSSNPLPIFSWTFNDPDPTPPNTGFTQTKVQIQVCVNEFNADGGDGSDACANNAWRWDSGEYSSSLLTTLTYLGNYSNSSILPQHPLDFGHTYHARLRAWDDTYTPSAWVTLPFSLEQPSGDLIIVEDFSTFTPLPGQATYSSTNGGELLFNEAGVVAQGSFNAQQVVNIQQLLASAAPSANFIWEFKRTTDSDTEWVTNLPKNWDIPGNGLDWRVTSNGAGVVGGFAISVGANNPPQLTANACRAMRLIGGTNDIFGFTVNAFDQDPNTFPHPDLHVRFKWNGASSEWTDWLDFDEDVGLMTIFPHSWSIEGNFTPLVQAKDQYGAFSNIAACDTILVGSATPAWLQSQNSDVFSGGSIVGRRPSDLNQYNATYLVQANNSIEDFTTEGLNCEGGPDICSALSSNYPQLIPLPLPNDNSQPLATILGSVDLGGILGERYGPVTTIPGNTVDLSTQFFNTHQPLNGTIVRVTGNATINSTTTIDNAIDDTNPSGAGLVIVDGDLFINAPVVYSQELVQNSLRRLASIGWLVKGNVYIAPGVWAVDSANPALSCQYPSPLTRSDFDSCNPAVVGTFYLYNRGINADRGIFFTGTANSGNDSPLKLSGLVVAQRFALQRNRTDDTVPSELFQYDGRVFANPPPGLKDFATALPRWRPLAPLP